MRTHSEESMARDFFGYGPNPPHANWPNNETCCHGWRWEAHAGMEESKERMAIARGVEAIRSASGIAPVGPSS